jgi:para-aminobenzoate synthetase/4-amino-4-deoxychorismate lyase
VVDFALIRNPETGGWLRCRRPVEVVSAFAVDDVLPVLARIDDATGQRGLFAVGFVTFEAAPAFDGAYRVHQPIDGMPLLHFGLFEEVNQEPAPRFENLGSSAVGELSASQSEEEYHRSVDRVRELIARGDTYQVNHTFRLRASFEGDPRALFLDLVRSQPSSFAAYLDMGGRVICSASPELFFRLDGESLVCRPMKGTADRGWDSESDREFESRLEGSPKDRAENAMIVDMVRNDLGRVARVGSVDVTSSFDIERHPTVFQMTSTVEAKTAAPVSEVIAALFPFASVTGAPKIRTMELINKLESDPRGVYTGAIGVIGPGRQARFSVAIRTAVVDREAGRVEYGVGSGVVWDSRADDEYRECVLKARVLSRPDPDFDLLETMLSDPDSGFSLLDRHLDRMAGAAEFFGRRFDLEGVLERLRTVPGTELRSYSDEIKILSDVAENSVTPYLAPPSPLRVRLLLAADGSIRIETMPIAIDPKPVPVRVGLAAAPVVAKNPFLHFKTTHRQVYETARLSRPDCDDVLLWNDRGEVTESTIANLVARIGGEMVTPPVKCGLLAGTFRAELLERGEITERVITVDEIPKAEALYLINSVQGWRDVEWVE